MSAGARQRVDRVIRQRIADEAARPLDRLVMRLRLAIVRAVCWMLLPRNIWVGKHFGAYTQNGRCSLGGSTIEAFCKDSATEMRAHNYGIWWLFGYDAQEFLGSNINEHSRY